MSCGIGGDLYALVWDAKTQKLYGLNASGRSPYKATRECFAEKGLNEIPDADRSAGRCPAASMAGRNCASASARCPLAQLSGAEHPLCRGGLPRQSEVIAGYWQGGAARLRRHPDAARTYLIDDRARAPATCSRTRTWPAAIASSPRKAAMPSTRAASLARSSPSRRRTAACFRLKDFADHTSTWVEPVRTSYRGYEVWEIPPPGQGIAVLANAEPSRRLRSQEDGTELGGLVAPVPRSEEARLRRPGALLRRSRLRQGAA